MTRCEAWSLHLSNALVAGTGLVYGWMAWLLEPADEFALVNHPLQPDLMHLHVLSAPLLVFATGLVWQRHVLARLRGGFRPRRRTGWSLAASVLPMIASGYLIQTSSDATWRSVWVALHLATSGLWVLGYLAHMLARRPAPVRPPAQALGPPTTPAPPAPPAAATRG
jgi:hypothetical protein